MTDKEPKKTDQSGGGQKSLLLVAGGFFTGMLVCAGLMIKLMPGMMLTVHPSRYATVEETVKALEAAIVDQGWTHPATRDIKKTMAKEDVSFDGEVKIVELCKADYAKAVLTDNPEVLTLMPCAWGVYKGKDGKVYISGMNMGLMGKLFGGTIAEVMGGHVAEDESQMLSKVVVK